MRLAYERGVNVSEVVDEVAEGTSSRFWIEEDRALRLIRDRRRGHMPKRRTREQMLLEIERRTEAILRSDPSLNLPEAVYEAVNSPAPSYYIAGRSVKRAIQARMRGYVPEYRRDAVSPASSRYPLNESGKEEIW